MRQPVRRFLRDERGAAAVEFAFLVPLMLANLFGMVEVVELFDANARTQRSAAAASDVISRYPEQISGAQICDVFQGVRIVAQPQRTNDLKARITFITVDSVGRASVRWSEAIGGLTEQPQNTNVTAEIPASLINVGTSDAIVRAEIELRYQPPILNAVTGPVTFRNVQYRRPRISTDSTRTSNCNAT